MRAELRDGLGLEVTVRGEGAPVLLLHGFTGCAAAFGARVVEGLARDFWVLAPDLLGHGRSSLPSDPGRYALEQQVDDLVEVLDTAGVERATWVGYSMGGRIALAAGVTVPERVASLVLEGASPGLADADARAARRSSDAALAEDLRRDGIEPFVARWMANPLFSTQSRLGEAVLEAERARRLTGCADALAASLEGAGSGSQHAYWHALPALVAPVRIIAGAEDKKFTAIGHEMAARLPHAELLGVADAGHCVHLERPDVWVEAVRAFVARDAGTSR